MPIRIGRNGHGNTSARIPARWLLSCGTESCTASGRLRGSFKYNRNLLQNILRLLSCTFPLRNMVCKKKYMRHASAAVPCKCRGSCSSFSDDPALPLPVLRSVRVHFRGLRTLPAGSMFCRTEKKSIADIFGKQPDTVDQQKQGKPPQQFAAPDEKQGKSGNPAADRN